MCADLSTHPAWGTDSEERQAAQKQTLVSMYLA